jgi:hypothetical protein
MSIINAIIQLLQKEVFVWKHVFIRDPLEITFSVLLILACLGVIIL